LSANGDWETDADEGPVWYPSGVGVGWEPYSCGNWTWVAPWGWTWVECEAWGFAPFHYGRAGSIAVAAGDGFRGRLWCGRSTRQPWWCLSADLG